MSNETLQLYVITTGKLELTDDGRWVSECSDHKYLKSLLHQFCDQISDAYKEKTSRTVLSEKYNESERQLLADFRAHRISFDSYRAQVNERGPNPESPLYRTQHNLGEEYLYLFQLDDLLRVLNASSDLVNRRMREIDAQS